jgi:hypothetical protein
MKKESPALHATSFMSISYFDYSSIVKIEVTCNSETSVDFQLYTLRYISEGVALKIGISIIKLL